MSSAEATTKACSLCLDSGGPGMMACMPPDACAKIDTLRHEVTRLKCDKLDLLKQNVVSSFFFSYLGKLFLYRTFTGFYTFI